MKDKRFVGKILVMIGMLGVLWGTFFAIGLGEPMVINLIGASLCTLAMAFIIVGCALAGEWL